MADTILTQEYLRRILDYDPETGIFRWRARPERSRQWNTRYLGAKAGSLMQIGYRAIIIDGKHNYEHRIAWLYCYGEWPPTIIDHINGCPSDNRLANLRLATHSQNLFNQKKGIYIFKSRDHGGWVNVGFFDPKRIIAKSGPPVAAKDIDVGGGFSVEKPTPAFVSASRNVLVLSAAASEPSCTSMPQTRAFANVMADVENLQCAESSILENWYAKPNDSESLATQARTVLPGILDNVANSVATCSGLNCLHAVARIISAARCRSSAASFSRTAARLLAFAALLLAVAASSCNAASYFALSSLSCVSALDARNVTNNSTVIKTATMLPPKSSRNFSLSQCRQCNFQKSGHCSIISPMITMADAPINQGDNESNQTSSAAIALVSVERSIGHFETIKWLCFVAIAAAAAGIRIAILLLAFVRR